MHLTIPDERAPGWNKTLRIHWRERDELVRLIWCKAWLAMGGDAPMFECPVDVHVIATFKGQMLDSDNICAKLYIDALKGRLLYDDDVRYVRRVTTESKRGKHNQVEIVLTEVNT